MFFRKLSQFVLSLVIVLIMTVFFIFLFFNIIDLDIYTLWSGLKEPQAILLGAVLTAFAVVIAATIQGAIATFWSSIGSIWTAKFHKNPCRILLVGFGRTGKTTLIKNLGLQKIESEAETRNWGIYETVQPLEVNSNKTVGVQIGDYRGQNPGQLFENFDAFAGKPGYRTINCILFVVDLFDDPPEMQKGIKTRVQQNIAFLNLFALSTIFYLSYSKRNLKCAALFINKLDLFSNKNAEKVVTDAYKPLIDVINRFCDENALPFIVKSGSALNGTNVRALYSEIIGHYSCSESE